MQPLQLGRADLHRQAIFLMTFLHLLGFTMGGPVLPALKMHFGVATAETGLITSAFPAGMFLASFIFPALSDRIGRKPVLVTSYLGVGTGFVLQAIAISCGAPFWAFLALRAGSGAFAGANTVVKAYLADVTNKEDLPSAMATREAAATLAYILGPLLGGLIFTASSLTCAVLCCGLASFASAASVLVCLRTSAGVEGEPLQNPEPTKESETKATPPKAKEPQSEARTPRRVVAFAMVIHFTYVFARACVDCFFVVFCAERFGLQPAALGRLMTAQACLMFLNSTVLYKRMVRATDVLGTAAVGMAIVCLSLLALGQAASVSTLVWSMVLYALGAPLFAPSITILLVRLVPPRRRGRVLGLDQAGCSLFRILSPTLMGLLFQDNLSATFVASGAVILVAALLATLLRNSLPDGEARPAARG